MTSEQTQRMTDEQFFNRGQNTALQRIQMRLGGSGPATYASVHKQIDTLRSDLAAMTERAGRMEMYGPRSSYSKQTLDELTGRTGRKKMSEYPTNAKCPHEDCGASNENGRMQNIQLIASDAAECRCCGTVFGFDEEPTDE